jgi:hypothetical protein
MFVAGEMVADLDLVARRIGQPAPGIAREFLVSNYHTAGPGVPKALVQLVDPIARLRIDIFPDTNDAIADAHSAAVGATSLATIGKASPRNPVDHKHWRDAAALAVINCCILPALTPHFAPAVMSTDVGLSCPRCELSRTPDFPLTPKPEIFPILDYV